MLKFLKKKIGRNVESQPNKIRKNIPLERKSEKKEKMRKIEKIHKDIEDELVRNRKHRRSIKHHKDVFGETIIQRRIRKFRKKYQRDEADPDVFYDEKNKLYFCYNFGSGNYETAKEQDMIWEGGKKPRSPTLVNDHESQGSSSGVEDFKKPRKKLDKELRKQRYRSKEEVAPQNDNFRNISVSEETLEEEEDIKSDEEKKESTVEDLKIKEVEAEEEEEDDEDEEEEGEGEGDEEEEGEEEEDDVEETEKVGDRITPEQRARIKQEFINLVNEKTEVEKIMFYYKKKYENLRVENEVLVKENLKLVGLGTKDHSNSRETQKRVLLVDDDQYNEGNDHEKENIEPESPEKKKTEEDHVMLIRNLRQKLDEVEREKKELEKQYNDVFNRNHELLEWNEQLEEDNKSLEKKLTKSLNEVRKSKQKGIIHDERKTEKKEERSPRKVVTESIGTQTEFRGTKITSQSKFTEDMSREELEEKCHSLEELLKDEKHRYSELKTTFKNETNRFEMHLKQCLDGLRERRKRLDEKEEEIDELSGENKSLKNEIQLMKVQLKRYQRMENSIKSVNNPFVSSGDLK